MIRKERNKMKKLAYALTAALLLLPVLSTAEETSAPATANAVAECVHTWELTAPYAGVTLPFDWRQGDRVTAGETVFELETVKLYAPDSGSVRGLFAREGDLCEDTIAQYGMLMAIERDETLVAEATVRGRYDSDENRELHLGMTVYVEQSNDADNTGEGRLVARSGDTFLVELTAGEFEEGDSVKLYRDEKMGSKTCIGQGALARREDTAVQGSGRILRIHVSQGDRVEKGQLLMELIPGDSDAALRSSLVTAEADGALGAIKTAPGQQVYKGQSLATLYDLSRMRVTAEVDELDLDSVHVGDVLPIVFDRYPDARISGTVTSVSALGVSRQNAAYFQVRLSFSSSLEILPGMSATVYLSAD